MLLLLGTLFLAFLLGLPWPARPARAQGGAPTDDDVNRVARQLYCPVCESTPLDVCPTKACADWRALIREKLAAGESDQQIIQYFVDTYGDRVLVQPPATGFNWLIYIVPPLVLLGGALAAWRLLGGLVRAPAAAEAAAGAPQDEYAARLEREVREAERD
jgi:cytochrome c-type biogenesis protein CcmH